MSYIGNSPGVASQRVTTTLTATAGQTQFTTQSGYVLGYVDVYLNGAKLVNGSDFEAITGTYITLFAGASAGDVVELISYVPRGLSDGYTKAEADAKFLDVGGDTASGALALATATLSGTLGVGGVATFNSLGTIGAGQVGVKILGPSSDNNWGGRLDLNSNNGTGVKTSIYSSSGGMFFSLDGGTTTAVNIASNGVGIGTTSPNITGSGTALTLLGSTTNRANLELGSATAVTSTIFGQIAGYNGSSLATLIQFGGDGTTDSGYIKLFTKATGGSATERLRVDSNGNTGIGTTSPSTYGKLAVRTSTNQTALSIYCNDTSTGLIADFRGYDNSLGELSRLSIQAGGTVFIGTATNTNSSKLVVNGTISQTVGGTQYQVVDQSDVGTAQNQIPLNQYLGSMAFQDRENINFTGGTGALSSLDIATISAQLNVSATDVFVYDTSRDSDGGAWRNRCQHTSWYNETLNTTTRGSRREFPAVAVIVATATSLTIYDGDDPTLPMWMVFNQGGSWPFNNIIGQISSGSLTAVAAFNAVVTVSVSADAVRLINFVSEETRFPWPGAPRIYLSNIQNRNASSGWRTGSFDTIGSLYTNDVAITVLPNAPVDSATGLPTPTIAVATNSGVSLIKDTGVVVSVSAASWGPSPKGAQQVMFSGEYILFTGQEYAYYQGDWYIDKISTFGRFADTASYDTAQNQISTAGDGSSSASFQLGNLGYQSGSIYAFTTAAGNNQLYYGRGLESNVSGGLYIMSPNYADMPKSMVAHIGKNYNSGWQIGASKGAWLCDTTQETIIGTNLVTNGTFDSNTTGWAAANGGTIQVVSGAMRITSPAGNYYGQAAQWVTGLVVGKTYTVNYYSSNLVNVPYFNFILRNSGGGNIVVGQNGAGWGSVTFVAQETGVWIQIESPNAQSSSVDIDNVSLRIADPDRSIYYKGLQTVGQITKTPVAANADLVAYSGFSSSNYLDQTYNSGLDFGTGDFSVSCWIKGTQSQYGHVVAYINPGTDNQTATGVWAIKVDPSSTCYVLYNGNSLGTSRSFATNWLHVCVTRTSGTVAIYFDGILNATSSVNAFPTSLGNKKIRVGYSGAADVPTEVVNGSIALLKISATAANADQIRKMYNDEKVLFQENAKATLYGTSDAVTAVAYDDDTKRVHAGTSSGRSVFQGLRRVDNTTTAVATAISAANGLVAEN